MFFRYQAAIALLIGLSHPLFAQVPLVRELSIGVQAPVTIQSDRPPTGFVADAQLGLLRSDEIVIR